MDGTARATIRDVARNARVSTASVSRALGGAPNVTEDVRARVMQAVRDTGYRVNTAARDLRRGRAASVLVLVPNLANPFFSAIIEAIGRSCAAEGLSLQVRDTRHGVADLETLGTSGHADGVICLDGAIPRTIVDALDVPLVMACEWIEGIALPGCVVDNAAGARLAAEHLHALGHRRLLHVSGPPGNVLSAVRRDAFEQGATERGCTVCVIDGDFSLQSGAAAADAWIDMDASTRPTGIFCASDECALGMIGRLTARGHAVPSEVSVCGFDDIAVAAHAVPPLTTIHQPRTVIGTRAASELLSMIKGHAAKPLDVLSVTLVPRESTAPVSQTA